jgi:hypothetical protein
MGVEIPISDVNIVHADAHLEWRLCHYALASAWG